jgi:hypothetical protein
MGPIEEIRNGSTDQKRAVDMTETDTPRRGFIGFLTTIPGILTALAALLTAVGTAYVAVHNDSHNDSHSPKPIVVNLTMAGNAAPSAHANVDQQTLRLDNASTALAGMPNDSAGDRVLQLIDQCNQGDTEACSAILVGLAQECSQGYGFSCDVLYEVSPVGSDYEAYGATCGGRFDSDAADTCRQT